LGRLAFDICVSGYTVEANEISLSMAAVAHAILQRKMTGSVHPFALDYFANEVEAERRYDTARFPDVEVKSYTKNAGNLSYTIGDFVDVYRWQRPRGSFSAVVTCFFIDTATNLYEYLATIDHLLGPGGVWVNIGPLRWHANSLLHPSVDELRTIVESSFFGFEIIKWSVDVSPSEYRSEENEFRGMDGSQFVRSTAYDGYRPLRFVAIKRR
jgi:carnosine N-methyltransferase